MMLLKWRLDRAQEKGVVAGLDSSGEGMNLYRKAGFVQIALFELPDLAVRYPVLLWLPKTIQ